jgi:beta-hydroxylase
MASDAKIRIRMLSKIVLILIVVIIVSIILLAEADRHYSNHLTMYEMYVQESARPLLAAYNGVIRAATARLSQFPLDEYFPAHLRFQQHWKEIAEEALSVYKTQSLPAFHEVHEIFSDISSSSWTVFVLKWYDEPIPRNASKCPITSSLIQDTPQVHAAMFSILQPGTRIPPHRGPSCASLRYHLGLSIPKSGTARIRVDKDWYAWKEGEGMLFDDTFEHEVINDTNEIRIILFMDVERPLPNGLSQFNRYLNTHVGMVDFVSKINSRAEVQEKI